MTCVCDEIRMDGMVGMIATWFWSTGCRRFEVDNDGMDGVLAGNETLDP